MFLTQILIFIFGRLAPPTVQSDRRSAGRPRTGESQSHVDLRIRILEDSQTEVLSTSGKFTVNSRRGTL